MTRRLDDVRGAMAAVPRPGFLPEDVRALAHEDAPLPIGHGATNSQPSTVAAMLRLLDVPRGASVLDVGSGSGWTTAILAELVGPGGDVLGVELEPELVRRAGPAVRTHLAGSRTAGRARLRVADPDGLGAVDEAPFDRILVSAMAREVPAELLDQLAPGGVMVIPVDGIMRRVELGDDGEVRETRHGGYRFVPLR